MKKLFLHLFLVSFLMITVFSINAHGESLRSIDTILTEIRQEQNISSTESIDILKVSLAHLEELGDSVMEEVIGNSTLHERMDNVLGGEGSKSLTNTHLRVGYNYLAGIPITMMTFMGVGGMMAYGGMMGGYGYLSQNVYNPSDYGMMGSFGWIWMIIGGFAFLSLLALGIFLFSRLVSKPMVSSKEFVSENKALLLVKERYARGEITREEYTKISEDLK
jgi:putative membrane protein